MSAVTEADMLDVAELEHENRMLRERIARLEANDSIRFKGLPMRKLVKLLTDGYTVNGYSLQRTEPDGSVKRAAVTTGGMVLWWGAEPAPKPRQLLTDAESSKLRSSLDFYKRRVDELQSAQAQMRDPERMMVCDILANGHLLHPAGDRYTTRPLTEAEVRGICAGGPVYAPDGVVTRTPLEYRQELDAARCYGIRAAEAAHGIT